MFYEFDAGFYLSIALVMVYCLALSAKNVLSKHPVPLKCLQNPIVAVLLFQHLLFCHFLAGVWKKIFDLIIFTIGVNTVLLFKSEFLSVIIAIHVAACSCTAPVQPYVCTTLLTSCIMGTMSVCVIIYVFIFFHCTYCVPAYS